MSLKAERLCRTILGTLLVVFLESQVAFADDGKSTQDRSLAGSKEIEFFETNDDCPTCKQHIDISFKEGHVCSRRESKEETLSGLSQMDAELETRQRRLSDITNVISDINTLNQKISQRNGELTGLQRTLEEVVDTIVELQNESTEESNNKKKERDLKKQLKEKDQKKIRNYEKVMSQVLQLGSVGTHMKDMIRLAKVCMNDKEHQGNANKIIEYIDTNFEGTVRNLVKIIQGNEKQQ